MSCKCNTAFILVLGIHCKVGKWRVNVKLLLLFPCLTHCLFYPDVNIVIFHFFWIS